MCLFFPRSVFCSFQDLDVKNVRVVPTSQIREFAMLLFFAGTNNLQWNYYIPGDSKVDVGGTRAQICGEFNAFLFSGREVN
jgi:hypothetical protein